MTLFPLTMRKLFLIAAIALLAACGGSGGGGGGGNTFPTPTLPAGARTITALNADETATSATDFVTILTAFTQLKTDAPPSMAQVIDRLIDQVIKRNRNARPATSLKTENLSSDFCETGSAIADFDESASSESGTITFGNCDVDDGIDVILVDGVLVYDSSWNNTTLDYSLHLGGTLTFDFRTPLVTLVLNLTESGNDISGNFSTNISFSLDGIPGGGYLATTATNLAGDFGGLMSGQLIVSGSALSRLRITVTGPTSADVDLDDGLGFVSCAILVDCTSPITF